VREKNNMRLVIKGLNYTEVHTHRKGAYLETIQFWKLQRKRKPSECGVWQDGEKIKSYEEMVGEASRRET